ncbi:MAG: hypothetical protein Q4D51_11150 [Eubacteriales bacterium]|nr:hypothetical protein [Eubacteriales bacterium]
MVVCEKKIDHSCISLEQGEKYFRYKYDYTKLGVDDYNDAYGGYVLAGEYVPNEESTGYQLIDEDKIVNINILGHIYKVSRDEIMK